MASDRRILGGRGGTSVWAVASLLFAVAWGGIGLFAMGLTLGLGPRLTDAVAPMVLLGGAALWTLVATRLFRPAPDGDRRGGAALAALAAACGLGYVPLCWALGLTEPGAFDPGTVVLVILPGVMALFGLAGAVYLWRAGSTSRPAEPNVAPDRRPSR